MLHKKLKNIEFVIQLLVESNSDRDQAFQEIQKIEDFEKINEVNKCRPQTSYGGMNQRRKKLQLALKSAKYRSIDSNQVSNNNDIF